MLLYRKRCLHESERKTLWLSFVNLRKVRRSRSQMFFKTDVLKNFANFTGKHLFWGLFSIKLQALFNKVSSEISQIFKNTFFYRTSFVKILQSFHFNIFGINHRGFRKMSIKKNNKQPWLFKRLSFLLFIFLPCEMLIDF